jgi:PEP-CTERM motif
MKPHFCLSIFALTTAILTAGSARAATFSVTGSVSESIQSFSVNQFDTSLGTLNSVTILQNTSGLGKIAFENTSTVGKNVKYGLSASVNLLDAITVTPLGANISIIPTNNGVFVNAYDGILDYGGSSGRTIQSQRVYASPVTALVDSASIGLFQGNGLVTLRVQIFRYVEVGTIPNGQPPGAVQVNSNVNADYTITYDYTPTPVPEPSTVLGMCLSGAFGLAFYRKKRSKSLV